MIRRVEEVEEVIAPGKREREREREEKRDIQNKTAADCG